MRVSDILRTKGGETVTVAPDSDVRSLVALLAQRRIGAVVLSSDTVTIAGIVSERDVVHALAEHGSDVLDMPVSAICTIEVRTVTADAPVDELMRLMTDRRIRHVPVVHEGRLHGIVSIGDVVKNRIDELETERAALNSYIATGS